MHKRSEKWPWASARVRSNVLDDGKVRLEKKANGAHAGGFSSLLHLLNLGPVRVDMYGCMPCSFGGGQDIIRSDQEQY
jgi:hypothetical protein